LDSSKERKKKMAFSSLARRLPAVARAALPRLAQRSTTLNVVRPVAVAIAQPQRYFSGSKSVLNTNVEKKLAALLKQERAQEEDFDSDIVKAFLKKTPFKLHDNPDSMEVTLTKKKDDELIVITFEYSKDLNEAFDNMDDEEEEQEEEEEEEETVPHLPFMVQVSKQANGVDLGTVTFECVADNGQVVINNVVHATDSKTALADDVNADWKRSLNYPGPEFSSLETELQELFYEYLDERGINTDLAEFLPEYISVKENKSYLRWLEHINKFMEK